MISGVALPEQFGAYVLLEKLGEGAQGDVHLARSRTGLRGPVVIKRLAESRSHDDLFLKRFRHEAIIASTIRSPNVAGVLDCGRVGDRLYIVMEYVAGRALSQVVYDLQGLEQHTSIASVADVVCGALDGLEALHTATTAEGTALEFVHRDVAPKNIMVAESGITKVIDLGLGRSALRDWQTRAGVVMGTPGYMAPEQAVAEAVDLRADLFSMGVVLFELLTLQGFMGGNTLLELLVASTKDNYRPPSSFRPDVPNGLDDIVYRAVRLDPDERFQTAAEFATAIRAIVPARAGQDARTLVSQMGWEDVAASRTRVNKLADTIADFRWDETEVMRQSTYAAADPIDTDPTRTAPATTPPLPKKLPIGTVVLIAVALAMFVAGWFGRGLMAPVKAPVMPTPTPTPTVEVVPGVKSIPAPTPKAPPRAAPPTVKKRVERPKRTPPPRTAAAPPPPPPAKAPPPPPPPVAKTARPTLYERAHALAKRAEGTPHATRAKELMFEATSIGLEKDTDKIASKRSALKKKLAALAAKLPK